MTVRGDHVEDILCNPIYVGIGAYPRIVEPDVWIRAAKKTIKQIGHEQFFERMFAALDHAFWFAAHAAAVEGADAVKPHTDDLSRLAQVLRAGQDDCPPGHECADRIDQAVAAILAEIVPPEPKEMSDAEHASEEP